ncbi:hypothetical protein OSI08_00440 [Mycobacterium ulcerans]
MSTRSDRRIQRWQLAIVVAAALGVFVALIAGWAWRPKFSAASLPEPVTWSHGISVHSPHSGALGSTQLRADSPAVSHVDNATASGSVPTHTKPFHSMWMTRGRPPNWIPLSPNLVWSPQPASLFAMELAPNLTHTAKPANAAGGQDSLMRLCVARC